jgi:hypothetical protein
MAGKEVRAGKAFVEIVLRDQLAAGLKRAAAQLRGFATLTGAIGAGLTASSGAILGPLAAAISQFSSIGSAVADMSARTGMSAEGLTALGYAASMTGASLEDVEKGIRKMQQNIADAASGSKSAAKALAALGLSAAELAGLSPEQQMQKIADGLARIQDPAMRTAAAMDIFGKSGTSLLPMMADGSAGMAAYAKEAERLGLVMSTEDASAADALGDATDRMRGTLRGLTLQIGAALAPAVTDLANRITACIATVSKFVKEHRNLVVTIAKTAVGLGVAGGAFVGIGMAALMASYVLQGFAAVSTAMGSVMGRVAGRISSAISVVTGLGSAFSAAAGRILVFSRMGAQAGLAVGAAFGRLLVSGAGSVLSLSGSLARLSVSAASSAANIAVSLGPTLWSGISTAATATVAGVRGALSAGSAAVGALVRGWNGDIGLFTNRVNTAFWTIGAKTREYVTTLKSGGLSQALALARSDFRQLLVSATASFRSIQRTVFATAATLRTAIVGRLSPAWQVVRSAGLSAFARIRQAGLSTVSVVGRGLRGMASGMGRGLSQGISGITGALGALGGLLGGTGLGAMLTTLPLVTTLLGGLATAVGALISPFGLVAAVIGGAIYAWTQWSQTGRTVLAQATVAFQQIYATVKDVFGGISDALAAGDIKLAAQILWSGVKVIFYQGVDAIQAIWPGVAEVAGQAWAWIQTGAASLMTWLAGLWAQLPSWITGPLGIVGESFMSVLGPAFSWLGQQFSQLAAWAGETFGGITNAIAAGDWGLAFEIAWASIKVAWTKGISWITQTWSEATTGLAMMFDSAVTAIRQIWGNVITWIASKLVQMYDGAMQILGAIAEWDPTGLAQRLHDALAIDTQGVLRTLQQDNQQNNRGLEQGLQQRNDARGQNLLDQQKAAEAELARLRQQRQEKLNQAQTAANAAGPKDWATGAAQAQAELKQALAAAAAAPKLFDPNAAAEAIQPPANDTADMAKADSGKGFSSQGTFSAAAVWGLSAGGVNERTAKAAESTAANTRQLVDHARRGRLVFG